MIRAELGEALEAYVAKLVTTGRYGSENEVMQAAVMLLQLRENELAKFDADIRARVATADQGHTLPAEEGFAMLRAKYRGIRDDDTP